MSLRFGRSATPLLLWAVGSWLMFYPTVLSGFRETVGNAGDPRLVAYLLEHTFRWVSGDPLHASLWSPPFYFPAQNVFAMSDALLGIAPLYWVWRVLGIGPAGAYQAFLFCITTLTYVAAFALFRRGFGREPVASAAGALLFAFGAPRIAEAARAQLLAHFYTPLAILALLRLFRSERREPGWSAAFVACLLVQLYSGFYFAWFLGLALLVALALAARWPEGRAAMRRTFALNARYLLGFGLLAGLLALPLALHYADAAGQVGFRDWVKEVVPGMPVPQSWVHVGPQSVAYFWLMNTSVFQAARSPEGSLGIGLVTTVLAVAGLVWARRERVAALIGLTGAALVIVTTMWPPGVSAWRLVYEVVPGAAAIRDVTRISLLVLLASAFGFAYAVEHLRRRSLLTAVLVIGIPVLEQMQDVPSYDTRAAAHRAVELARRVGPDCTSFYYAVIVPDSAAPLPFRPWKYQLDAMGAQLHAGVPTINGYSGWSPPAWRPLYHNRIADVADTTLVRRRLARWSVPERACVITAAADNAEPPRTSRRPEPAERAPAGKLANRKM